MHCIKGLQTVIVVVNVEGMVQHLKKHNWSLAMCCNNYFMAKH